MPQVQIRSQPTRFTVALPSDAGTTQQWLNPPAACPLAPSLLEGAQRAQGGGSTQGSLTDGCCVRVGGSTRAPISEQGAPPAGRSPWVPPGDIKAFGSCAQRAVLGTESSLHRWGKTF